MGEYESGEPLSPQERLTAAKAVFRGSMLQNDTLFSVIQARLQAIDVVDAQLPEFGLEPTLQRLQDGTSVIGLQISHSTTTPNADIQVGVSFYDHLPLGQMNRVTGETRVTKELETALIAVGKTKSDALDVLQAWQAACSEMNSQFPGLLTPNPITHTLELDS